MQQGRDDSIVFAMHIFDSELVFNKLEKEVLKGYWNGKKTELQFKKFPYPYFIRKRPFFDDTSLPPTHFLQGKWRWHFDPGTDNESKDLGIFNQVGSRIKGSIATPTGDYGLIQNHFWVKLLPWPLLMEFFGSNRRRISK